MAAALVAICLALLTLTLTLPSGSHAAEQGGGPPEDLPARSWIVVDASDGHVITSRDPDERSAIASTTKLMTAYLALRDLDPDKFVRAPRYTPTAGESLMGLQAGERVSVRDLLYGLLLPSGNDAAAAIATVDAGSVDAFVGKMNEAAENLGLDETHYGTPVGLDEPDNYSTAHDLVSLAQGLLRDPLFARIVDTQQITLDDGQVTRTLENRNTLLGQASYFDGVKTGFTADAGNVLVGSANKDGARVVSAVLGAPTEEDRDSASRQLLEYGLAQFVRRTPVKPSRAVASVPVAFSGESLDLLPSRSVSLTMRRDQRVRVAVDVPGEVRGPVAADEKIGSATVTLDGKRQARISLLAASPVAAPSLLARFDSGVPGPRAIVYLLALAIAALVVIGILQLSGRRRTRARSEGEKT